jgi:hypothetical protein
MRTVHTLRLFILCVLLPSALMAQTTCEPDQIYADSTGGVYPRPYTDSMPEAGINVIACAGQTYFFNFTVNVPDSIQLGTLNIPVSRVRLRTTTPVRGLPQGLNYVCNPGNCDMPAGTLGCIALVGTVNAGVAPGVYPLEILVDIVTTFGLVVPTQFPNEAIAPGTYFIVVGEPDGACNTVSVVTRENHEILTLSPNPTNQDIRIDASTFIGNQLQVTVTGINGQIWYTNQITKLSNDPLILSIQQLPPGNYIAHIADGQKVYTGKFQVIK